MEGCAKARMRIPNNNRAVIKKLVKRTLNDNQVRSIFVVLAIMLMSFMVCSVFTIRTSYVQNLRISFMKSVGSSVSAYITNPTQYQLYKLKKLVYVKSVGAEITLGNIVNAKLDENDIGIRLKCYNKSAWEKQNEPLLHNIKGNYPKEENEIMTSKWVLNKLGVSSPTLGMAIELEYEGEQGIEKKDFLLSGIYEDYLSNEAMPYFVPIGETQIMVSEKFVQKQGLTYEKDGVASVEFNKGTSFKEVNDIIWNDADISKNQRLIFSHDISKSIYLNTAFFSGVMYLLALFMMFSGYLMLYNVMGMGVSKNINFYGLLKTLGTTSKQIEKVVRGQAIYLSIIGIPMGLVLGTITSYFLVPIALRTVFFSLPTSVVISPLTYLATVFLVYITVLLSCRRPAKIAGKISPIKSTTYIAEKYFSKSRLRLRKTPRKNIIFKMAIHSVLKDKRRFIIVFLSMFVAAVTFLIVGASVSSIKVNELVGKNIMYDYQITTAYDNENAISEKVVDQIVGINEIEEIFFVKNQEADLKFNEEIFHNYIKYDSSFPDGKLYSDIYDKYQSAGKVRIDVKSISMDTLKKLDDIFDINVDYDLFEKGETVLLNGLYGDSNEKSVQSLIGKTVVFNDLCGEKEKAYKIAGIALGGVFDHSNEYSYAPIVVVSESEMKRINPNAEVNQIYINVRKSKEVIVESKLNNIISDRYLYTLKSRVELFNWFMYIKKSASILGNFLALVFAFIGILNFLNAILVRLNVRQNELVVMQSVGMTKKQILKMFFYEGIIYSFILLTLVMTLGNLFIHFVSLYMREFTLMTFYYPGTQMIILIAILIMLGMMVPLIGYVRFRKGSVVKTIKNSEF